MASDNEQRMGKSRDPIDYATFSQMLTDQFPEVPQAFDKYGKGLLHCEMGMFSRITKEAMDEGRFWQVEKYFRFIELVRENATLEVKNAIDLSYIEHLAFCEVTDNRLRAIKRMPKAIRDVLLEFDGRGRWA